MRKMCAGYSDADVNMTSDEEYYTYDFSVLDNYGTADQVTSAYYASFLPCELC